MDEDLFFSLQLKDHERRAHRRSAPYTPKMTPEPGRYFYGPCDDLMSCLELP